MNAITIISHNKVRVSKEGVTMFNWKWPGSNLDPARAYWWEFDDEGDLVDCDLPDHADGDAALAMCDDCKAWLFDDTKPEWIP